MRRFALERLKEWKEKKEPEAVDHSRSQAGRKDLAYEGIRSNLF